LSLAPEEPTDDHFYELLREYQKYRAARLELLAFIGCHDSNRDPLAEFSERLVVTALGGTLAESRVQKGWDFKDPEGRRVQVRYLTNPEDHWVNEHQVTFKGGGCDLYALVVFAALGVEAILIFDGRYMTEVCEALGKRHPDQDHRLDFTRANYRTILGDRERFKRLGVRVIDLLGAA
jgi:hypothetical protein